MIGDGVASTIMLKALIGQEGSGFPLTAPYQMILTLANGRECLYCCVLVSAGISR